ncbi:hypothetical protein V8F20_012215 [Naviculisporaceae sp. PSN 640]
MSRAELEASLAGSRSEQQRECGTPRKKLRKGTTSCWECKRRKVRCLFAPTNPTHLAGHESASCDGCQRRGTACVSQEFSDVPNSARNNPYPSSDRLGRVEALVEQLIRRSDLPTPPDSLHETEANQGGCQVSERRRKLVRPVPNRQGSGSSPAKEPTPPSSHRYAEVSRALREAWPSTRDLDLILDAHDSIGTTVILRKIASYTVHPKFLAEHVAPVTARDFLTLPPPESHPITIARKLLLLGIFIQFVRPGATQCYPHPATSETCHDIMTRVMDVSSRLVTSNDELVGSLEGIECLMLESLYKDTAGSIRLSWVTTRRAITIAQMMGLQRGRAKMLQPEARARFDPEYMWFRLVQSDRYLSLLLGLPQGQTENPFATVRVLQNCEPWERLQRLNTVAGGRIIQRNDTGREEMSPEECVATTREIDALLQDAADSMHPDWWVVDDILTTDSQGLPSLSDENTMRLMDQIVHYSLLVQLHLPFLLRFPDHKFDYNKMTAVNASREVLRRFVIFRKAYPVGTFCRGVDFLAFIATAALCLAHMEGKRLHHHPAHAKPVDQGKESNPMTSGSILRSLTHQRQTDRGLMERATKSLELMGASSSDVLASKLATLLRHLLAIEQDATSRADTSYSADLSPGPDYGDADGGEGDGGEGPSGCSGNISQGGNVLNIYIPYYGTVKIEKLRGVTKSSLPPPTGSPLQSVTQATGHELLPQSRNDIFIFDGDLDFDPQSYPSFDPELAAGSEDWTMQGVDMAFFDSIIRGMVEGGPEDGTSGLFQC